MSRLQAWAVAAIVGLMGLTVPDRASADYFKFGPEEQYDIVQITYAGLGSLSGDSFYAGNYLGQVSPTLQNGSPGPNPQSFYTYCVDLTHEVSNGDVYQVNFLSTVGPDGLANNSGAKIAYLYQNFGGNGAAVSPPSTFTINGDTFKNLSSSDYAAAVQVAIWDELAGDTLSGGNVTGPLTIGFGSNPIAQSGGTGLGNLVADLVSTANNANTAAYSSTYLRDVRFQTNPQDGEQSFLYPTNNPSFTPNLITPEPSTFVLAAFSLVCVIPVCYWRRRQSAGASI